MTYAIRSVSGTDDHFLRGVAGAVPGGPSWPAGWRWSSPATAALPTARRRLRMLAAGDGGADRDTTSAGAVFGRLSALQHRLS